MLTFIDNLPYPKENSAENDLAEALTLMYDRFFNTTKYVYTVKIVNQAIIIVVENVTDPSRIQQEIHRSISNQMSVLFFGVGDQVDENPLWHLSTNDSLSLVISFLYHPYHNLIA